MKLTIIGKIGWMLGYLPALLCCAAPEAVPIRLNTPPTPSKRAFTDANGVQIDYPFRGFSDAMRDEKQFEELASAIRELGVRTLRFPGGCSAYTYSISGAESLDAFKPFYFACDSSISRWADYRDFFRLCQATGCRAVYQLNIGRYYDPERNAVFTIAPMDSGLRSGAPAKEQKLRLDTPQKADYDYAMLDRAVADAAQIARTAREMGVDVLWEFGNEDYIFFSPETFVRLILPFADAVRKEYPGARFIVCSDGITWEDWSWPLEVYRLAKEVNLPIAFTSFHIYVSGGGGGEYKDGLDTYESIIRSWGNIAHLHDFMMKSIRDLGYPDTAMAITEGNVHVGAPIIGQPYEHGMGRALGEAAIFPDRISRYALLIHHDLVRSGPEQGTWFCRLFYFPDANPGTRYKLPTASRVMGRMARHAGRAFLYDDGRGVAVSEGDGNLLFTAGNPGTASRELVFDSTIPLVAGTYQAETTICDNLDTPEWHEDALSVSVGGNATSKVRITLPPYSFALFTVPCR